MRSFLVLAVCVALGACAQSRGLATTGGATSLVMFDALKSEDEAAARDAVATIEAHPGAYLPSIFGGVAREMLERGRTEDAILWSQFGLYRLMEDLNYAGTFNGRATHMSMLLMLSYERDEGEVLKAAVNALPPERRVALMRDIDAMSARYARQYPHDWGLTGRVAYEVNYAAAPSPWRAEQIQALNSLRSRMRAEFVEYLAQSAEAAAAPEQEPGRGARP